MPTSVRLDPETERLIARLSRTMRRTKSQVIRDAIGRFAREEAATRPTPRTPYDALEHLIGVAGGGPPDLSVRTGDKFRRLVRRRRGAS
jgi:hypothetical protein